MSAWLYRRLQQLGHASYDDYLASEHWQRTRQRFRARDARCFICRSRRIQLHHRTYVRLGCERDEDLVPLCWRCHKEVHRKLLSVPGLVLDEAHEWVIAKQREKQLRYNAPSDPAQRAKAREVGLRQLTGNPKSKKLKRRGKKRRHGTTK